MASKALLRALPWVSAGSIGGGQCLDSVNETVARFEGGPVLYAFDHRTNVFLDLITISSGEAGWDGGRSAGAIFTPQHLRHEAEPPGYVRSGSFGLLSFSMLTSARRRPEGQREIARSCAGHWLARRGWGRRANPNGSAPSCSWGESREGGTRVRRGAGARGARCRGSRARGSTGTSRSSPARIRQDTPMCRRVLRAGVSRVVLRCAILIRRGERDGLEAAGIDVASESGNEAIELNAAFVYAMTRRDVFTLKMRPIDGAIAIVGAMRWLKGSRRGASCTGARWPGLDRGRAEPRRRRPIAHGSRWRRKAVRRAQVFDSGRGTVEISSFDRPRPMRTVVVVADAASTPLAPLDDAGVEPVEAVTLGERCARSEARSSSILVKAARSWRAHSWRGAGGPDDIFQTPVCSGGREECLQRSPETALPEDPAGACRRRTWARIMPYTPTEASEVTGLVTMLANERVARPAVVDGFALRAATRLWKERGSDQRCVPDDCRAWITMVRGRGGRNDARAHDHWRLA